MKKNILFVNDVLSIGGVEISLIDVLNNLDYSQISVDLFILHPRYELLSRINKQVRLVHVDERRCKLTFSYFWLYLWLRLFKLISLRKTEAIVASRIKKQYDKQRKKLYFSKVYDIVIAYKHSEAAEFVMDKVNASKKIFFYHQGDLQDYELHKQAFAVANSIVAVSSGVAKMLAEAYPDNKDKIVVIENLVDSASILNRSKEYKAPVKNNKYILASCGRLNPEKGFDLAVAAAKHLSEAGYDYHWYFVGDGTRRRQLEELIGEKGLGDRISITGMIDNPLPYIAACDIYVQPSYTEAFGLSIAEAKVLKKPIVSTWTIGAKHLILDGVTGILTAYDGEAIAGSIRWLMDDEDKSREIQENLARLDYEDKKLEFQRNWHKLLELSLPTMAGESKYGVFVTSKL